MTSAMVKGSYKPLDLLRPFFALSPDVPVSVSKTAAALDRCNDQHSAVTLYR